MSTYQEYTFFLTTVFYIGIAVGKTSEVVSVSTTQLPNAETSCQIVEKIGELNYRLNILESQHTQIRKLLEDEKKLNMELKRKLGAGNVEDYTNASLPKNCIEVKETGNHLTGTYTIRPKSRSFTVLCDMNTRNGGWVVFQNRFDGSQDFFLYWDNYKNGFGDFAGEFWLGLEHLYEITDSDYNELLVELSDLDNKTVYAQYHTFRVGSEGENYVLKLLDGFTGDAGDSLFYQKGMKFSTRDRDNDKSSEECAVRYTGAWWYNSCLWSNLNGRYLKGSITGNDIHTGICWSMFHGGAYSLKKVKMMVRPRK